MKLLVILFLTTATLFAQDKSTPAKKDPPARPAAPIALTEIETSRLENVSLRLKNNEQEKTILNVTLQFLHEQICTAHEVDVKSCRITADGKSIVAQPPITKDPAVPAPATKKQ